MKSDVYVLRVITDCTFSEHLSVLIVWLCDDVSMATIFSKGVLSKSSF
jgi:hypothetical protein